MFTKLREQRTRKLLNRVCDIINQRGWTRNQYVAPDGRVCLWGAVEVATYGVHANRGWRPRRAWQRLVLKRAICRRITGYSTYAWPTTYTGITQWNDTVSRTSSSVKEMLGCKGETDAVRERVATSPTARVV